MRALLEQTHQAYHFARTLTYLGEYQMLQLFTSALSAWVEGPSKTPDRKMHRNFVLQDIKNLYREDAQLFIEGVVPWKVLLPESPLAHAKRWPKLLINSLKMSRQRKLKQYRPSQLPPGEWPEYFKRNFHWQHDGYFSQDSAELYPHQVEILFTGTAAAMRRLLLFALRDFFKDPHHDRPKVLELAAGSGEASLFVLEAYPQCDLTLTDLSPSYLKVAREKLASYSTNFQQCAAEDLPLKDNSLDIIYSVFLFHEIPPQIREKVLAEAWRVLKPGGMFILVDSIQTNDVLELNWALEKFPQDYHEPFYQDYIQWNMKDSLLTQGFEGIQEKRGFLSKSVWARKPH
jgi:ubiquinone/menaquinone biosynthesis C-methylase UbiE